jgi:hypothetical protein
MGCVSTASDRERETQVPEAYFLESSILLVFSRVCMCFCTVPSAWCVLPVCFCTEYVVCTGMCVCVCVNCVPFAPPTSQ